MDKQEEYVSKLNALVKEGKELAPLRPEVEHTMGIQIPDNNPWQEGRCYKWYLKGKQLIENLFGQNSEMYKSFTSFYASPGIKFSQENMFKQVGLLEALSELIQENGIRDIKGLGRIELSGDMLKDARELLDKEEFPLNIPAIYARILLENSIKEFAKGKLKSTDNLKFSKIIEMLKTQGIIKQSFERELQAKYDIGNDAAHKDFSEFQKKYVKKDIIDMLDFIEQKVLALIGG